MAKIISIHSYRGGTGKSNSTANLATLIAMQGKRVGIIDTDLPSPGIHILFSLGEEQIKHTFNDFLWNKCKLTDAACDITYVLENQKTHNSQMFLVPSSVKVGDISRILREGVDSELMIQGFKQLIKGLKIEYLLIDTHPGLNEETLLSLTISDLVLLVMRPDQQDFQGTAVTVEVARRLKVPNLKLLVNKVLLEYNTEQMRQKIETTYNVPVAGLLPETHEMLRLGSRGLFCLKYPNHEITKVLRKIAEEILVS